MPNVRSLRWICSRYWRWFGPRPRMPPRCVCTTTSRGSAGAPSPRRTLSAAGCGNPSSCTQRCTRSGDSVSVAESSNMRVSTAAAFASGSGGTEHLQAVAAPAHLDAEALLDVAQVLLHRPREVGEPRVVGPVERDLARLDRASLKRCSARGSTSRPRSEFGIASVISTSAKRVDQRGRTVEIDPAVVLGAARELARIPPRRPLDEHALHACPPSQRLIAQRLLVQLRLQALEARAASPRAGRRRAARPPACPGRAAVDEAETLVEADLARRARASPRSRVRSRPGKPTMKSRRDADAGPHFAQPAELLLVLEHGVAALHQREHAVGAALHRQVQVVGELRHVAVGLDEAVAELDRVRGREADALDARHFGDEVDQRREVRVPAARASCRDTH